MYRFLCSPFLIFAMSALAQSAEEAPAEKANIFTVVVFLVLFVGSCLAYFGYVLWAARKKDGEAVNVRE